jgi:hypothetical protein
VAANQISLELFDLVDRDRDVRELSEPGRHAIDASAPTDGALDDAPRCGHSSSCRWGQRDPRASAGDLREIVQSESAPRQPDAFH